MAIKLRNLEGNLEGAIPVGRPQILKADLPKIGIHYRDISMYFEGFDLNDKPKIYNAFVSQITAKVPSGANAFSCSDIMSFHNPANVGIAVQYYKIEGEK